MTSTTGIGSRGGAGGETDTGTDPEAWFRLPPPQRRLLFLHQLDPADPAYNVGLAVALGGPLNPHWCTAVVDGIERRHPALRMRFGVRRGDACGTVAPPAAGRLPIVEVGSDGDGRALLAAFARRPVDLGAGPPARWCLVSAGPASHVLALVVHHIVFDGASVGPLVADLEALAAAARSGAPGPPPPSGPAAADRPSGGLADGLAYWRETFRDPPSPVGLWPAPGGPPAPPDGEVADVRLALDPATRERLVELGRGHRTSLLTPVAALLAAIVHRYTAGADVVIGMPTHDGDGSGIGHRINVLPIRIPVPRPSSYDELVRNTREAVLGALEHRHVPFEDIVDAVGPARNAGVTPLFQVLLATRERPDPPRLAGITTHLLDVPTPAARYALEVTVTDGGGRTELAFQADPRLCTRATLQEFVGRFRTMLHAALADPTTRVGHLPMHTPATGPAFPVRRRTARRGTGAAGGPYEVVAASAARHPDRVAVHAADGALTYAELTRRARRSATELRRLGAGPERVVAVCLDRRLSLPVAILAVARTGAAFLPLDPGLPDARLRVLVGDSGPTVFVGSPERAERCGFRGPVVDVDLGRWRDDALPGEPDLRVTGHPELAAYVLATSGSTGRPKLVVMRRAGFAALLSWARETFGDDELGAVVALTSIGFDLSIFEVFVPLSAGGTVHLLDAPGDLAGALQRRATLLNTVPSVLETLLDLRLLPPSTAAVNVAGEPLPGTLVDRVSEQRPHAAVRNLYGPTEATTYVTGTGPLPGGATPTIGHAVAGAQLRVTDDDARLVPSGVPGELLVGGPPLARGYLGAAASTAAAFVPDAIGSAGARVYRTGDVVRAREDGELEFLGRRDHQVKVRGVRIELEEVQAALRAHPDVAQAVVIVRGEGRDRRLVGCVGVGERHRDVDAAALTYWLRERLPEVMTPRDWVIVARLPVTANGKTDRAALDALPTTAPDAGRTPPRTAAEEAVARCWHDVLGRSDIGVHDVFFDAGGNSLTLMLLHAALQERLDSAIRLADLFRSPTVAGQAALVEARARAAGSGAPPQDAAATGAARGSARRQELLRRRRGR